MCSIPVWCRNRSLIKVSQENLASEGLDFITFAPVRVWIDQHRWCSCSIIAFQAIDMRSVPVRCKSYNKDRNFALIFVTKENTTRLFSFFHEAIQEHHWCSRNIAAFQAIDMGSIPVRRKITNRIRIFSVNHAPEGFRNIVLSTVQIQGHQHRWRSGSTVAFLAIDMSSLPVRCRSYYLNENSLLDFVTDESLSMLFSPFQVRVGKHRWRNGSGAAGQATDMGLFPARCRSFNMFKNFSSIFSQMRFYPCYFPFSMSMLTSISLKKW